MCRVILLVSFLLRMKELVEWNFLENNFPTDKPVNRRKTTGETLGVLLRTFQGFWQLAMQKKGKKTILKDLKLFIMGRCWNFCKSRPFPGTTNSSGGAKDRRRIQRLYEVRDPMMPFSLLVPGCLCPLSCHVIHLSIRLFIKYFVPPTLSSFPQFTSPVHDVEAPL